MWNRYRGWFVFSLFGTERKGKLVESGSGGDDDTSTLWRQKFVAFGSFFIPNKNSLFCFSRQFVLSFFLRNKDVGLRPKDLEIRYIWYFTIPFEDGGGPVESTHRLSVIDMERGFYSILPERWW
jgi:hypothetical protein